MRVASGSVPIKDKVGIKLIKENIYDDFSQHMFDTCFKYF